MGFLAILQAGALIVGSLITIAGFVHDVRERREKENQVFSPTIMFVGCVVVGLIAANILVSKKTTTPTGPALAAGPSVFAAPGPTPVQQQLSIRQQQADEAAAAVAGFFRKADEEAWVEEQIDRAQAYFARAKQSSTSKP